MMPLYIDKLIGKFSFIFKWSKNNSQEVKIKGSNNSDNQNFSAGRDINIGSPSVALRPQVGINPSASRITSSDCKLKFHLKLVLKNVGKLSFNNFKTTIYCCDKNLKPAGIANFSCANEIFPEEELTINGPSKYIKSIIGSHFFAIKLSYSGPAQKEAAESGDKYYEQWLNYEWEGVKLSSENQNFCLKHSVPETAERIKQAIASGAFEAKL